MPQATPPAGVCSLRAAVAGRGIWEAGSEDFAWEHLDQVRTLLNICLFSLFLFLILSPELASVSSELGEKPRGLGMKSPGVEEQGGKCSE